MTDLWAAVVRERDAATERAEKAERERDEAREETRREVQRALDSPCVSCRDNVDARAEAERELAEMRADRDSWRQQCEDARGDALRYGRERDEANCERGDLLRELSNELAGHGMTLLDRDALLAHARACLDPEIVSRDPAHARLAALVERIEGGR